MEIITGVGGGDCGQKFDFNKMWLNVIDGKVQDLYVSLSKPFEEWKEDFEAMSELEDL